MKTKYYIASLTFNSEEIQRFIGRRGETDLELKNSILQGIGLTIREVVVDAPDEMMMENEEKN